MGDSFEFDVVIGVDDTSVLERVDGDLPAVVRVEPDVLAEVEMDLDAVAGLAKIGGPGGGDGALPGENRDGILERLRIWREFAAPVERAVFASFNRRLVRMVDRGGCQIRHREGDNRFGGRSYARHANNHIGIIDCMAPKKIYRAPYTPSAIKPEWTNQTIRLSVKDNKRLKRAALRRKMSFNAWAVQTLLQEAGFVLEPNKDLNGLRDLAEQAQRRLEARQPKGRTQLNGEASS